MSVGDAAQHRHDFLAAPLGGPFDQAVVPDQHHQVSPVQQMLADIQCHYRRSS